MRVPVVDLRASHARTLLPAALASVPFGFVLVRVRVRFVGSFRSCRAIQGGFLLLAMLVSYLVNDTWPLPSLPRSTGYGPRAIQGGFLLLAMLVSYLVSDTWSLPSLSRSTSMGS